MVDSTLQQFIIALIAFCLGNMTGYVLHDRLKQTFNMNEEASKNFLLVVVTVIWAISMLVDIVSPNYDVPVTVHAIMGAIVGFFFYRPKNKE